MSIILISVLLAVIGGILFTFIGLISGTDETAIMVPITLLVILLGAPPAAVLAFFMAAVLAKHLTHAIPTALMGIPGDTTAVPLLDHATTLRRLGVPHVALRKMISGGLIGAFIALPVSVLFAQFLSQFADFFKSSTGIIFTIAAILIAYLSKGRWVSILMILPFALFLQGLDGFSFKLLSKHLSICFFLGIAIGPMFADLLTALSPTGRTQLLRAKPKEYVLAPEVKSWSGYFPNPFRVLSKTQNIFTAGASFLTSLTFTFSPVGMTALMGELVGSRVKGIYKRSTTSLAVMNGVTESTYVAETIIPLLAFGLPLSPMALGPASALYNAPPVFTSNPVNNIHNLLTPLQFFLYAGLGMVIAALIAYPFSMNYARRATLFVMKNISQEAVIAMFIGLAGLLSFHEGQLVGVVTTAAVATFGGLLNRLLGVSSGVQFMIFYSSAWMLGKLF